MIRLGGGGKLESRLCGGCGTTFAARGDFAAATVVGAAATGMDGADGADGADGLAMGVLAGVGRTGAAATVGGAVASTLAVVAVGWTAPGADVALGDGASAALRIGAVLSIGCSRRSAVNNFPFPPKVRVQT